MARRSVDVTFGSVDTTRIPDKLTEGAAELLQLSQRGKLDAVGEKVHIRRQGGYCGLDVVVTLWLFFAAGATRGVRRFWELLGPHVVRVAAVAGRRRLPSPASLSRALDATEADLVRAAAPCLLLDLPEIDAVLRHPVVQSYDARGEGWHVFDLDPTVTTLRQRALPDDDDLPEPRRRAAETGAPGHSGRKRGDLQFRRVTVQHSGSGAWVHAHLSPGNGEGVVDFERALDTVVQTCERLVHPLSRALVRMDGEYGNVPWFTACRERRLPFITRLNRPKLYEDPEVLALLRAATWYEVPDSRSGPRRAAAELGIMTVHPDRRTKRPDGSGYGPISVRVVASIFPRTEEAKRGRVLDGWQVELFAVDLPADAWPAPDAIAAYFGRTAQENRFAQEDRELGLDRIVSYHLPGQELAALVGLSVWNLRLARGFALDTPPAERPVQQLRTPHADDRVLALWPRDPVLRGLLDELDWSALLQKRPGWTWDTVTGELLCEEGRPLVLTTARKRESSDGRTGIVFCRPEGGCEDCSARSGCLHTDRDGTPKHAEFSIPTAIARQLRERLRRVRTREPEGVGVAQLPRSNPGPRMAIESMFLPAEARRAYQRTFLGATLHIEVERPSRGSAAPTLLAFDPAARQRRRKTWDQNLARYQLQQGARVRVDVAAAPALRAMLGDTTPLVSRLEGRD